MTTIEAIEALETEAAEAGDMAQVELCREALDGDHTAVVDCLRVILESNIHANIGLCDDGWALVNESGQELCVADCDDGSSYEEAIRYSIARGGETSSAVYGRCAAYLSGAEY